MSRTANCQTKVGVARGGSAELGGRREGTERGSATLWALMTGLALIAIAGVGVSVGAVRVGHHKAQVAADLGALAGAAYAARDSAAACTRAAAIVTANGGRLVACTVDGLDVRVMVEVMVGAALPMTAHRVAGANARAGPVRG